MRISIKLSSVQSWDSFPTTFATFDISQDKKASSAEKSKGSDNVWCECPSTDNFWNCSMVSSEAEMFLVGRLMMDINICTGLQWLQLYNVHILLSDSTLISNYLFMPQVEYTYKTYDWNFRYESNAFPGFDFDLDEVWAPLNPHLKHVTKGSPSKDEICHCLELIFLLE